MKKKLFKILGLIIGVVGLALLFDVLEQLVVNNLKLGFLWNMSIGLKATIGFLLIVIGVGLGASFEKIKKILK